MNSPDLWVFERRTGPDTLKQIRQTFAEIWRAHAEVPASVRTEIGIATGEIAANIVEHASAERPVNLRMEVAVLPEEVQVRFIDDGIPLQVDLASVDLPDATADRGRGLPVAKAVLRILSYQRDGDGNRWTLLSERFSG